MHIWRISLILLLLFRRHLGHLQGVYTPKVKTYYNIKDYKSNSPYIIAFMQLVSRHTGFCH